MLDKLGGHGVEGVQSSLRDVLDMKLEVTVSSLFESFDEPIEIGEAEAHWCDELWHLGVIDPSRQGLQDLVEESAGRSAMVLISTTCRGGG